ncbi:hypothetical protein M405DRAFT_543053 [Rhizopogon salebrosus TDB-379]|nr:hypothetical protein M405DRAFT_543053 [Rhizopogon salebrosus TDB-379]
MIHFHLPLIPPCMSQKDTSSRFSERETSSCVPRSLLEFPLDLFSPSWHEYVAYIECRPGMMTYMKLGEKTSRSVMPARDTSVTKVCHDCALVPHDTSRAMCS